MDLRRQIAILRAWIPLAVVCVVLAAGAAYAVSSQLPKVYEAKTTLIVGQSLSAVNPDYSQLLASQLLPTTYATVATTRPILDAVIAQLGLNMTSNELLGHVQADAPVGSTLLTISAQDADPERASEIANALSNQLLAASPAIQGRQAAFQASIDSALQATQDQITTTQAKADGLTALAVRTAAQDTELATLQGSLVSLRATYATLLSYSSGSGSNLLSIIEPAVPPVSPVSPRPLFNALLAALVGLLIAAAVAAVAEYLDDAIKDPDMVLEVSGLNTLGMISRIKGGQTRSEIYRLVALLYPRSSAAEAYRTLRTNIEFASVDGPIRTLLVTSSAPGEGKTVTAANLAVVFAQAGHRILLVDADLRKPGIHAIFDLPNTQGLTTLLRTEHVNLEVATQATEQDNLRVLTTGPLPPNPAELLGSQRMRAILEQLKAGSDLLIFDSPPLQAVTDAAILSSFMDGTILVIDASRRRRGAVRLSRGALDRAGAKVLGAVLNRIPVRAKADYADYYGAYGGESATPKQARTTNKQPERSAP